MARVLTYLTDAERLRWKMCALVCYTTLPVAFLAGVLATNVLGYTILALLSIVLGLSLTGYFRYVVRHFQRRYVTRNMP